jgi:hypothetical protein
MAKDIKLVVLCLSFISWANALGIRLRSNPFRVGSDSCNVLRMSFADVDRRAFVTTASSVASLATFGLTSFPAASAAATQMWKQVKVPFEDTLYDIDFDRLEILLSVVWIKWPIVLGGNNVRMFRFSY